MQQVLCTTMETFVTDGLKPALEQKRQYDREAMDYDNMITKHKSLKKSGKVTPQKEKESEQQLSETRDEYLATEKTTLELLKQAAMKGEMLTIVKLLEYWDCMSVYFKEGVKFLETMQPKVERYRKHIRELSKAPVSSSSSPSVAAAQSQTKVFKMPLQKLCERENRRVPMIIVASCKYLAEQGLDTQGVFRVSPTKDHLDELKSAVDQGRSYNFSDVSNVHVVSGLLKAFFREMPEPIFTFERYAKFMEASKLPSVEAQVATISKIIKSLPEVNYKSIQHVSKLCVLIDSRKDENKMTISNLATVLTPNMLYTTNVDPLTMVQEMEQANKIYTLIVEHYSKMFPEEDLEKDELPLETLTAPSAGNNASVDISSSTPTLRASSLPESSPLSASTPSLPTATLGEEDFEGDSSTPAKKRRIKMTSSLKLDTSPLYEGETDDKKRTPRSSRSKKGLKTREDSINSGSSSTTPGPPHVISSPIAISVGTDSNDNNGSSIAEGTSPDTPKQQHQRSAASAGSPSMASLAMEDLKRTLSHRQMVSETSSPSTAEGETPKSPGPPTSDLKKPIKPPKKKISVSSSMDSGNTVPVSPSRSEGDEGDANPTSATKLHPSPSNSGIIPVEMPIIPPRPGRMSLPPSAPPPAIPTSLPPPQIQTPVETLPLQLPTSNTSDETSPTPPVTEPPATATSTSEPSATSTTEPSATETTEPADKPKPDSTPSQATPSDDNSTKHDDTPSTTSDIHDSTEKPVGDASEVGAGVLPSSEPAVKVATPADSPIPAEQLDNDAEHEYLDELSKLSSRPPEVENEADDDEIPLDLPEPSPEVAVLLDPSIQSLVDALLAFARSSTPQSLEAEDGIHKLSQTTRELATQARSLASTSSILVGNFPEAQQAIIDSIEQLQSSLRPIVIAVKEVSMDVSSPSAQASLQQAIALYASHITSLSNALSRGSIQQLVLAAQGALKRATAVVAPTIRAIISSGLEDSVDNIKAAMRKEIDQLVALTTLLSAQLIQNVLADPLDQPLNALPGLFNIFWQTATEAANSPDPQESAQTLVQHAKSLMSALRDIETAITSATNASPDEPTPADLRAALSLALDEFSARVAYGSTSSLTTRLLLASAKRTIKRFTQASRSFEVTDLECSQEYVDLVSKLLAFIKYHRIDAPDISTPALSSATSAMMDLARLRVAVIVASSEASRPNVAVPLSHVLRITQHIHQAIFT